MLHEEPFTSTIASFLLCYIDKISYPWLEPMLWAKELYYIHVILSRIMSNEEVMRKINVESKGGNF